jgi:hypothetical protein
MTLHEFNKLDKKEQSHVVWEHGVHLATRLTVLYTKALYQIEGFYAEVIYDQQENKIVRISGFHSTEELAPYLKQIDLSWI